MEIVTWGLIGIFSVFAAGAAAKGMGYNLRRPYKKTTIPNKR